MLNLLILRNTEGIEHIHQHLRTKQTHQIILQGNVEAGFTRISLTSGTAAQLIIDTSGLMAFGSNELKTAQFSGNLIKLDISTTAGHIGSDGNRTVNTSIGYNLRLQLMELRIQNLMRNAAFL